MCKKILKFFLLSLLVFSSGFCDKPQYWQRFTSTNWEKGKWKVYSYVELRFFSRQRYFHRFSFSQRLLYKAYDFLEFEAHYTLIESRPTLNAGFVPTHRLELEINPSWKVDECLTLKWRNRYELLKEHHTNKLGQRLRHRIMFYFSIKNSWLQAFSIHDEIFYNLTTNEFFENRFVPVELAININPQISFRPFVMILTRKTSDIWNSSLVLGSQIDF